MRTIETRTATVDTMAVTIQALHVSGKQMTLSVFRQLPTEYLCNADSTRNAALEWWGLVRYPIKDSADAWVVVEKKGILYRAPVESPYSYHCTPQKDAERLQRFREYVAAGEDAHETGIYSYFRCVSGTYETWNEVLRALGQFQFKTEARARRYEVVVEALDLPQLYIGV